MDLDGKHLSDDELTGYGSRALIPSELLRVDDHMQVCESCYARFAAIAQPTGVFEFSDEGPGADDDTEDLLYIYLESYVNGRLRGRDLEMFESHLKSCRSCASEARALRDLRSRLSEEAEAAPNDRVAPIKLPAYVWRHPRKRLAFGFVVASICILGLVFASVGNQLRALRSQIAALQREDTEQQQAIAAQRDIATQLTDLRQKHDRLLDLYQSQARELDELRHRGTRVGLISRKRSAPVMGTSIVLNDGSYVIKLEPNGGLTGLGSLPASYRNLVKTALESGRAKIPTRLKPNEMGTTQMGESPDTESFRVVSPVGVAVLDDRPILRWRPLRGSASYTVTISDSSFEQVVTGVATTDNWTPTRHLPRGRLYYWQVRTVKDGKEIVAPPVSSPPARFLVLSGRDLDQLRRAREARSDSHLLLGVIYASLGLIDNAIEEFQALQHQNPGSEAVQQMLSSLSSLRR